MWAMLLWCSIVWPHFSFHSQWIKESHDDFFEIQWWKLNYSKSIYVTILRKWKCETFNMHGLYTEKWW